MDIGGGLAVAFKVESHNHPSAVEPHAGAATGVGGILRDIFTMGARPIALFDSLRFGALNGDARTRFLLDGVVKGISDYGNAVGVPTVGGEIVFDPTYRENPLVNVMCIGVVSAKRVARGWAKGAGNPVLYVGSSTGRDGLGGASFASREITEGSEADRPAVQIGDPFAEKCLIEATLEALATGDVIGIQDMGAAGLTCSSCEMPSRGGSGIEIDVAKVPRREAGMTPYEIMLSESQERMLLVAKRGREAAVMRIFAKWGLNAVVIGRVTSDGRMRVKDGEAVVADIPVAALTTQAPVYRRPLRRPRYLSKVQRLSLNSVREPKDYTATLLTLLSSPTIASKALVYEQYDHMVQANTVVLPGRGDAAVLRIKGTDRFLAATTDGNGRYCYLDSYEGGKLAVAEAARNLVCVGAKPLAITNCLNFGNPEDPEIMWQFAECVRGIGEACRALGTPVTGGNVSFYNESPRGAIDPTPVIGMIGLIEARGSRLETRGKGRGLQPPASSLQPVTANFKDAGDAVVLLGETREELGGSEYLAIVHGRKAGRPPRVDLAQEAALHQVVLAAARSGWLKSAHDCSEGGLAVALAECCLMDEERLIGASIAISNQQSAISKIRNDALLFGESAGRIVVSCARFHLEALLALAARHGVPAAEIGRVGGTRLTIAPWIDVRVDDLNAIWRTSLMRHLAH
jgi:phosphoribosylformylglycinamidine synthase